MTNGKWEITSGKSQMGDERPPFEIKERTLQFAVRTVRLVRQFPRTVDASQTGRQLL
jgi:hypothetical protein